VGLEITHAFFEKNIKLLLPSYTNSTFPNPSIFFNGDEQTSDELLKSGTTRALDLLLESFCLPPSLSLACLLVVVRLVGWAWAGRPISGWVGGCGARTPFVSIWADLWVYSVLNKKGPTKPNKAGTSSIYGCTPYSTEEGPPIPKSRNIIALSTTLACRGVTRRKVGLISAVLVLTPLLFRCAQAIVI
jgi:hypothetical protein